MAKKNQQVVPEIIDSVEGLNAKMAAMREAQKIFATYTQEQVDKIFFAAAARPTRCGFLWQRWLWKRPVWALWKTR